MEPDHAALPGLLQKLNLQEKLVQRRLPNLKEHARLLVRTPGFEWRTKTAVEYLEAIKEQLLKGGQ